MPQQFMSSDKLTSMSRSIWILVLAIIALPGCWSKDFQEPGRIQVQKKPTEAIIAGNFQRVWAATQAALGKFPMIRKDVDAATARAYVVTDWNRGKSDVLYHGFGENRMPYVIRYKLFVYLSSGAGGTKVTIKNVEQYMDDSITAGVDLQGGLYTWIKTESSSLKENSILEQVNKLVHDPQFKGDAQ